MTLLLDTNALIWLLSSPEGKQLGPQAKESIRNAEAVYTSSVNVLEIRIKAMLGKLEAPEELLHDIEAAGLKTLPFTIEHADAIRNLSNLSKHDPFDRMLLAQAQVEGMSFLTSDRFLIDQSIGFLLNARD